MAKDTQLQVSVDLLKLNWQHLEDQQCPKERCQPHYLPAQRDTQEAYINKRGSLRQKGYPVQSHRGSKASGECSKSVTALPDSHRWKTSIFCSKMEHEGWLLCIEAPCRRIPASISSLVFHHHLPHATRQYAANQLAARQRRCWYGNTPVLRILSCTYSKK